MKRLSMVFYIILSFICFSSCSNVHKNDSSQINSMEKEISVIKDVVQNKKEFLCTENNKYIYLKDFHTGNYLFLNDQGKYEYTSNSEKMDYYFDEFSVIDMDGDGYPELLLEESKYGNILLLHYEDGIVYGFVFPYRGLENVKKDASFESSGGANINYTGTVQFSKGKIIFNEICRYDGLDNIYRINGENVSQEEAHKCLQEQDKKENAEWYDYNESNLEKYLVF